MLSNNDSVTLGGVYCGMSVSLDLKQKQSLEYGEFNSLSLYPSCKKPTNFLDSPLVDGEIGRERHHHEAVHDLDFEDESDEQSKKLKIKKRRKEISLVRRFNPLYHAFIEMIEGTFISDEAFSCPFTTPNNPHKVKILYKNGSIYSGECRFSLRNGLGTLKYFNGEKYEGSWFSNVKHGYGKYLWPNGDSYEGDWKVNMMWGQGKLTLGDGGVLVGEFWKNELLKGEYIESLGSEPVKYQIKHPQKDLDKN